MADVPFRTRRKLWLAGIETTPGVEEALTVGANAIKAENPNWSPNPNIIRTDEATSKLDDAGPIVGGISAAMSGDVFMKGSGTAGTAPEQGVFWRAGGLAEHLLGADITGTASAGSANTITVPDASAMRVGQIMETTAGAGSGQTRAIKSIAVNVVTVFPDWTTPPDVTTQFAVRASALYTPADTGLEVLTSYLYDLPVSGANARLRKLIGGVSEAAISIPTGGLVRTTFSLSGKLPGNPADVADPGAPTFDAVDPVPFLGVDAHLGQAAVQMSQVNINLGNSVQLVPDPAETLGFDQGTITRRNVNGTINPRQLATATRDEFADFTAGAVRELWLSWGSVAGNRMSIFSPAVKYTGAAPGDDEGISINDVPFEPVDGALNILFW